MRHSSCLFATILAMILIIPSIYCVQDVFLDKATGNDDNDGLSLAKSVNTLPKALEIGVKVTTVAESGSTRRFLAETTFQIQVVSKGSYALDT
jgi:hypothetical protein